jgi:ribosome biogenesis GTPase A
LIILGKKYGARVRAHYNLDKDEDLTVENVAKSRNWIVKGAQPDMERTSTFILCDFRDGKIGKFILDEIKEL